VNPFDLKTIVLAKHAQHVVLIHFPIALFLTGVGFDTVAQWKKSATTAAVARYNVVAAALATPPVLLTGVLAWYWGLGAPRVKGVLLLHLLIGGAAGLLMMVTGWLQWRGRTTSSYRLPLEFVGAALVAVTAHLGGFLSGVNS